MINWSDRDRLRDLATREYRERLAAIDWVLENAERASEPDNVEAAIRELDEIVKSSQVAQEQS